MVMGVYAGRQNRSSHPRRNQGSGSALVFRRRRSPLPQDLDRFTMRRQRSANDAGIPSGPIGRRPWVARPHMKIEANWPMKGEGGRFANLRLLACEPLLRLLVINWAIGVAVAAMTLGGLLALNTGGLRTLVFN